MIQNMLQTMADTAGQMYTYSPFDKVISELDASDLAALRTVTEGWYVEYKREPVRPRGFAKAIAAFANTYGGWLFVGIEEADGPGLTASAFPGVTTSTTDHLLQLIRQSLSEWLSTVPYYETTVIHGPCDEIGLESDNSIVVIHVLREQRDTSRPSRWQDLYTRRGQCRAELLERSVPVRPALAT